MSLIHPSDPVFDVKGWYQTATERRELLAMDDRMLRDVGLTRIDALQIAERRPARVVRSGPSGPSGCALISLEQRDAHIERAHRLRQEAIRNAFAALFRWLRPSPVVLPQPIARVRKLAPVAR